MKLFVSWSGGKDCMLALYRILQDKQHEVSYLINMCELDGLHSRSHGIQKHLVIQQARFLDIKVIQPESDFNSYETVFKDTIMQLKSQGVTGGIFGDIYLLPHREWIERVCNEIEIQSFFPLWNENTTDLISEFIRGGFKSILVSVNAKNLTQSWLGRQIDLQFVNDIIKLDGIDPCAENGEYHSFVYDGPIFKKPVPIKLGKAYFKDNHWFLDLQ